jgi:hypothetical protein
MRRETTFVRIEFLKHATKRFHIRAIYKGRTLAMFTFPTIELARRLLLSWRLGSAGFVDKSGEKQ